MIKKIVLSLLAIVILFAVFVIGYIKLNASPQVFEASVAGLYQTEQPQLDPSSERSTQNGKVIGFKDNYNTQAWLGIPYAQAPIGDLRWKAPKPARNWSGKLEANNYGDTCIQFWGVMAGAEGQDGDLLGSEDCLFLNIWSPQIKQQQLATSKKPVMFWIHGGGNDSGTANTYQGHHLAGSQDVIVVAINYRLGFLGWFSHDAVRGTSENLEDASGNYGTLDIIAALKWVQNNISAFGGDPDNVTIFGESAGGRNVYSMLASPLAKGLFHKAISQSGTPDTTKLALAEDFDDKRSTEAEFGLRNSSNGLISLVLEKKYPNLNQQEIRAKIRSTPHSELMQLMRDVDPKDLMKMAAGTTEPSGYIRVARVLRDGHVLPKESTLSLFSKPENYNSVPMILGSNRDEQKIFMVRNPEYVDNVLGFIPKVKDKARYDRIAKYISDNWKAGAVDEPAKIISSNAGAPVFAYRFDWDEEPSNWLVDLAGLIGAGHGMEISFVFGDFKGGVPMGPLLDKKNAQGREQLSLAMMDYWAQFARTGQPSKGQTGSQAQWRPWSAQGENVMLLDTAADSGSRMAQVRDNVAEIKQKLAKDDVLTEQKDRCEAYAFLFLHGYQSSDFWNADEYSALGCDAYPVGEFRQS